MLQNYNKILTKRTVILNYTRIKPRSSPPQKKSAYFTHPDFSAAKAGRKSAQITRANMVFLVTRKSLVTLKNGALCMAICKVVLVYLRTLYETI